MLTTLTLRFKVLTPLFLGGARQDAEVRAPSFKGALRAWYRAIDPEFATREQRFFGGVGPGAGQAPFLMRVEAPDQLPSFKWDARSLQRAFQKGTGPKARNGVTYLGYTLGLSGNEARDGIPPGARLEVSCVVLRPEVLGNSGRRALLASWWLLAHVGSLGTRARRGFGSLSLEEWSVSGFEGLPQWRTDLKTLPLLAQAASLDLWAAGMKAGVQVLREWFPGQLPPSSPHAHLGPRSGMVLMRSPHREKDPLAWARPMEDAGLLMQNFRVAYEPDRARVRNHLLWANGAGGEVLSRAAPDKVAFGLPLAFRFQPIRGRRLRPNEATFSPADSDHRGQSSTRHPSPIWIRVVECAGARHALITRLDGALPGAREGVAVEPGGQIRGSILGSPGEGVLVRLMEEAARQGLTIELGGAS